MELVSKMHNSFSHTQPERLLKRGDMILFMPPPAAYSQQSKQARCAGKKGFIAARKYEYYGIVVFKDGQCLCNLSYCEKT